MEDIYFYGGREVFLDDSKRNGEEEWYIGAGGAITALCDLEGELGEKNVELDGVICRVGACC